MLDIVVADAFTGRRYSELGLSHRSSAKDLAAKLQELTGVVAGKQILLFGPPYTRLDSRKPLTVANKKSIFLFDRALLGKGSIETEDVVLEPSEISGVCWVRVLPSVEG